MQFTHHDERSCVIAWPGLTVKDSKIPVFLFDMTEAYMKVLVCGYHVLPPSMIAFNSCHVILIVS